MTRRGEISRRQFLSGAFRERNAELAKADSVEHQRFLWKERAPIGLYFTAPEPAPKISVRDDAMDGVLREMEDLKGIEDF